jgi:hypothetical protein
MGKFFERKIPNNSPLRKSVEYTEKNIYRKTIRMESLILAQDER